MGKIFAFVKRFVLTALKRSAWSFSLMIGAGGKRIGQEVS
jgi:hypothetical protein